MSYDLNTVTATCNHQISAERYVVDTNDFRTLRLAANPLIFMRAPVNGLSLVKLYIRGVLVAPDHAVYGYNFVQDTTRLTTTAGNFYKIVFNHPVRWSIPLIEVSYTTLQTFCLKCSGIGKLNDLKQAASGSFIHIIGTDKLVLRSLKFILTSRCPFYPQFTCPLKDFVGRKFSNILADTDVASSIQNSLQNLKNIQAAQRTIQTLDPQEMLKDITNVSSQQDTSDPTILRVAAQVSSYGSQTSQPLNFTLKSSKGLVGQPGQ